jgi:hypothetical protein
MSDNSFGVSRSTAAAKKEISNLAHGGRGRDAIGVAPRFFYGLLLVNGFPAEKEGITRRCLVPVCSIKSTRIFSFIEIISCYDNTHVVS